MSYSEIDYAVSDGIATIAFNRPDQLNTGTPTMVRELLDALDEVDADDYVRVVIVTGNGRAFCAGADLSGGGGTFDYESTSGTRWGEAGDAAESAESDTSGLFRHRDGAGLVTLRLFDCTKPVIAAVNGPAVGMGATMALAMDLRLASERARFGFVFTRRGIVPEGASAWFLPRLVGVARAAEWLYTGRVFDAPEALGGGLVRSVHPPDELLPAARALATEIVENTAPVSVALTRQMLWRMLGADHPMDAHRVDSRAVLATGAMADAREGVMSFLEKRRPQFSSRVSHDLPDVFPDWRERHFS